MFDVGKIREGGQGLVGIRQPFETAFAIFDNTNISSSSGYFVDDVSLFKVDYFINAVCPAKSTNQQINTLFQRVVSDSLVNVCNDVFIGEDFIDRQIQYSQANNLTTVETSLPNGFVGQRFIPSNMKDLAFRLNQVYLQVQGNGNLTLLLFNSNQTTPIQTKTIVINPNKKTYKVLLNWACDNTEYYKGEWYVGYIYNGNIKPYRKQFENSIVQNFVKELYYEEIIVSGHLTNTLFDLDKIGNSGNISSGLNFDITAYEDKTDFILSNLNMFAKAVQLQFAIKVFNDVITSPRINSDVRQSNEIAKTLMVALKGLEGQGMKELGLEVALSNEISRIKEQVRKMQKSFFGKGQILVSTAT